MLNTRGQGVVQNVAIVGQTRSQLEIPLKKLKVRLERPEADENFAVLQQQIYFTCSFIFFAELVEDFINSLPTKLYTNT